MTVTTNTNKTQALGNDVTTSFPYSFRIYSASDLVVTSTVIATGVDTELVLNTDYTVTGAGSYNGGNVVFVTAPTTGVRITIMRVLTVTQGTDLRNQGAYFAETHEDVFDRHTMVDQQQQEQLERCLTLPASSNGVSVELPAPEANNIIAWNTDGTALENHGPIYNTILAAALLEPTGASRIGYNETTLDLMLDNMVLVNELSAESGSSLTGFIQSGMGAVATTVQDKARQTVSVIDFGADNTGTTDSTAAFSAAGAAYPYATIPYGTYLLSGTVTGTATYINLGATINGVLSRPMINLSHGEVSSEGISTNLLSFGDQQGSIWRSEYHSNWNVVRTKAIDNPTEWQVYTNAAAGIVQTVIGTNQVNYVRGTLFKTAWVGKAYLYIDGVRYKVATVTGTTQLTVQTPGGGAVVFGATSNETYYFSYTSVENTVNTNGTAVTLVSGPPFIPFATTLDINGVTYNVLTWNGQTSITLTTSAGVQTGVTASQDCNINDSLSTLRLQGLSGSDEENFAITHTPAGTLLQSLYAGGGSYRPITISTGENPVGTLNPMVGLYPSATLGNGGTLTLGGSASTRAIEIPQDYNNVNYLQLQGAATTLPITVAARGNDTNVSMVLDAKGTGNISFTSHSFASTEFQVFGVGGTSWLAVQSDATAAPILSANGAAANIDIKLAAKGSGLVWVGPYVAGVQTSTGYISVKDSSGVTRRLLCL